MILYRMNSNCKGSRINGCPADTNRCSIKDNVFPPGSTPNTVSTGSVLQYTESNPAISQEALVCPETVNSDAVKREIRNSKDGTCKNLDMACIFNQLIFTCKLVINIRHKYSINGCLAKILTYKPHNALIKQ